jgi:hypothetical protein
MTDVDPFRALIRFGDQIAIARRRASYVNVGLRRLVRRARAPGSRL